MELIERFSGIVTDAYREAGRRSDPSWQTIQQLINARLAAMPVEEREALQQCFQMMSAPKELEKSQRLKQ